MDTHAAYRHCEEITWSQARNFAYGIRLLPPAKRQALAAVYAFARRIDDMGDGDLPAPAKLAALSDARASVTALTAPRNHPGETVLPGGNGGLPGKSGQPGRSGQPGENGLPERNGQPPAGPRPTHRWAASFQHHSLGPRPAPDSIASPR